MRVQVTFKDDVRIVVDGLDSYTGAPNCVRLHKFCVSHTDLTDWSSLSKRYKCDVTSHPSSHSDYLYVGISVNHTEIKQVEFIA